MKMRACWIAMLLGCFACGGQNVPAEPVAEVFTGGERTLWKAGADLNGDGTPEEVVLISEEVLADVGKLEKDPRINVGFNNCAPGDNQVCDGVLRVGDATQALTLRAGFFGGLGIRVIDINKSDKQRELLLTQRGPDTEDPPYRFSVVIYDGKDLHVHELFAADGYSSGEVRVNGEGMLRVVYKGCPDTTMVDYTLAGAKLTAGEKMTKRVADAKSCPG